MKLKCVDCEITSEERVPTDKAVTWFNTDTGICCPDCFQKRPRHRHTNTIGVLSVYPYDDIKIIPITKK